MIQPRELTSAEMFVLHRICESVEDPSEREIAIAQVAAVRWAGPSGHGDQCFDLVVSPDASLLDIQRGPLGSLLWYDGDELVSMIHAWVIDGRLTAYEQSWETDRLPAVGDDLRLDPGPSA
jgi:hypothetical protein